MKLIVIGRNPQEVDIVLNSQYISNYHAEIIQLDNGDMFLVDKSTNGTFLNGVKLTPGKEVAVKRGDNITFADVPLDWSLIEEVRIPKDIKQIKSIGSHYMNTINVQGPNVSRFHATIRQMSDNKWYICDHSKNGTLLNGVRLQKNRFVRIKKGDEITCAGVPVQNPIPGPKAPWGVIGAVAAVACACVLFALILIPNMKWSPEKISSTYSPSVGWVRTYYHFEVSCSGYDLEKIIPTSFTIDEDKEIVFYQQSTSEATCFFIGDDGHIVTNRHAARPWEYTSGRMSKATITLIDEAEAQLREYLLQSKYRSAILPHLSTLKVKGVVDATIVVPSGSYYDSNNVINCHEVACGSLEEDLAVFKIRNTLIANNIKSIPYKKIKVSELDLGNDVYTIGFPLSLLIQDFNNKPLQPYFASGSVSNSSFTAQQFGLTATSFHGASGSPVFDNKGNLIGILNQGLDFSQGYNYAIKVEYLDKLLSSIGLK